MDISGVMGEIKKKLSEMLTEGEEKPFDDELSRRLASRFTLSALIFGILLIFLVPPMSSPDENSHFLNVARISTGRIFPSSVEGEFGSEVPAGIRDFINTYNSRYFGIGAEVYNYIDIIVQSTSRIDPTMVFVPAAQSAVNPLAYCVPAAGALLEKLILRTGSAYNMLVWARLFNLLFYTALVRLAIIKTPIYKNSMALLALMPMSLMQAASTSYDVPVMAGMFLLFAYSAKIMCADRDYIVSREDIIGVCFACALVFAAKIAYAPVALVLFAADRKKFGSTKRYIRCIILVALMGIIFWLVPFIAVMRISSGCTNMTSEICRQQAEYMMREPFAVFSVTANSLKVYGKFYMETFFGKGGLLDASFPSPCMYGYIIIIIMSMLADSFFSKGVNLRFRAFSVLGTAVFLVSLFYVMYRDWTPVVTGTAGGPTVEGVQGRYFIPTAIFIAAVISNPLLTKAAFGEALRHFHTSAVMNIILIFPMLTVCMAYVRSWM